MLRSFLIAHILKGFVRFYSSVLRFRVQIPFFTTAIREEDFLRRRAESLLPTRVARYGGGRGAKASLGGYPSVSNKLDDNLNRFLGYSPRGWRRLLGTMYVPRVTPVNSFHLLEQEEKTDRLDPHASVGHIAFQKLLKVSVKRKASCPQVRSFGELSDLDTTAVVVDEEFDTSEEDFAPHIVPNEHNKSMVELTLLALWERCAQKGLFRYDVTGYPTKTLPGSHGFLFQLNDGRASKKRSVECKIDQVVQPFDENKFNFGKAKIEEVLFQFDTNAMEDTEIDENAITGRSPDLVMINFCPIEYGHVLLVPKILDRNIQIIDRNAMSLALQFASAVGNPYFRLIYNSFGAYASVNHLHFQGYFLMAPFPSERAPTVTIPDTVFDQEIRVSELMEYPVKGWVFEMVDTFDRSLKPLAFAVGHVCQKLQMMNVPHNMFVTDCGGRVILWPQCFQEREANGLVPEEILETEVRPAVSEIAGHFIVKRRKDFESFTQDDVWKILSYASLTPERFAELTGVCIQMS